MVKWHEGRPDFRVMDMEAVARCVNENLCGICGEKMGATVWWIGGPLVLDNQVSVDPPMHKTCALESMRICPFLNGRRPISRLGGFHQEVHVRENISIERPETMYLMYSWAKNMRLNHQRGFIETGRLTVEREF